MTIETITPEIVAEEQTQLLAVVQQNALPPAVAQSLQSSFAPLFTSARSIMEKSRGIVVTDASQKLEIKLARECRLALREVRVKGDKVRKELKDQSLREGRAIDGFQNILLHITETEERRLDDQEKFAERQEVARKLALKEKRTEVAIALQIDPTLYQLGEMSDETFNTLVEGTKLARAAAAEAARKAEAERIAKEAAEQAERERIRQENARLKREADEKEAALKVEREAAAAKLAEERRVAAESARVAEEARKKELAAIEAQRAKERQEAEEAQRKERLRLQALADVERQKADTAAKEAAAKAKVEREAREKAEAELKRQHDTEAKRIADEEKARKKAAAAPDRAKISAYWSALDGVMRPDMTTLEGQAVMSEMNKRMSALAGWLREEAGKL